MSLHKREKRVRGSRSRLTAVALTGLCLGMGQAQQPGAKPDPRQAGASTQSGAPGLRTRSAEQGEPTPQATVATGQTSLPPEAEGRYPWDKLGGEITLYFENGQLHGYMTSHMDPDPHTAPITFDFATTNADGHAVEWTTRTVHDVSYSFSGHLERGLAASPSLPGYYVLTGTLAQHGGQAGDSARTVSLKREPGTV